MKVGLITIYQVPNYGSVLQTYATQFLLESMGVECKVINYRYPNEWHWKHGTKRPTGWKAKIRRLIPSRKIIVLQQFREKYLNFTPLFHNLEEMNKADWSNYDAFVVGSDQVWNARFVLGDSAFMLSFVPDDKPRYSLASSFALKSIPECFREKYFKYLSKFNAISVRENNGMAIIHDELKIHTPVNVILDPTLLLSKEDWLKAISRSNFKKRRPYILFYMLSYAFEPRPYIFKVVKHFQEQINCDIIALEGYTKPNDAEGLVMINMKNSSIEEFIDLFDNADMVITSSFHGTAFALNFGKPLVSIVPDSNGDDRQTTLLCRVGCKHCAIKENTPIREINPNYNANVEQIQLNNIRHINIDWIRQNLLNTAVENDNSKHT